MESSERAPRWWLMYLFFPGAVGLLWMEASAPLTRLGHEVALIGVVIVLFAVAAAWLHTERRALTMQSMKESAPCGDSNWTVTSAQNRAATRPNEECDG